MKITQGARIHARIKLLNDCKKSVHYYSSTLDHPFVEPPPTTDGTIPILDLDRVAFSDNDGDGSYLALYDNFVLEGVYRFVIYGQDSRGDLIGPKVLEVDYDGENIVHRSGDYWLYLPVIQQ